MREVMCRVEAWLDEGMGDCILRSTGAFNTVGDTLHGGDGHEHIGQDATLSCRITCMRYCGLSRRESCRWRGPPAMEGRIPALLSTGISTEPEHFGNARASIASFVTRSIDRAIQYIGRNPQMAGLPPSTTASGYDRRGPILDGVSSRRLRRADFSPPLAIGAYRTPVGRA